MRVWHSLFWPATASWITGVFNHHSLLFLLHLQYCFNSSSSFAIIAIDNKVAMGMQWSSRDKPKWKNAALWYQNYFGGSKLWFSVKTSSNKVLQSAKHFCFSDKIVVFLIVKIKAFSSRFNLAHFWCSIWAVSGQASYCRYSTILLWGPNLALLSAAALPYVDFWTFCKLVLNYLYFTQLRAVAMLW